MIIVIEGCDFSGKTTLINTLERYFKNTTFLREPGSEDVAEELRKILKSYHVQPDTRQLLMHASRLQMCSKYNLEDPDHLYILDRYYHSMVVYGGISMGDVSLLTTLLEIFPVPVPDITFILQPPLKTIMSRAAERKLDPLEGDIGFLKQVYAGYLNLPNVLDGTFKFLRNNDLAYFEVYTTVARMPLLTKFLV